MKVILDKSIWNRVFDFFEFDSQSGFRFVKKGLELNVNYNVYKLGNVWTEEQEKIVNDVFKEMSNEDIYALDWQHDCFEFNPNEQIPLDYQYHDDDRNCEVYFPSYYPNGDYYLFISKDFSYGLLGHPWLKEIYVFGDELIKRFEEIKEKLNIVNKNINILDSFFKYEVPCFPCEIKNLFDEVLKGDKQRNDCTFNETNVVVDRNITKIEWVWLDNDTDNCLMMKTEELYKLICDIIDKNNLA